MVEIQNNTGTPGDSGATGVIIGILVILIIALAFYFGFWSRRAPASNPGVNVQVTNPGASSPAPGGSTSGNSSGGTSGGGY